MEAKEVEVLARAWVSSVLLSVTAIACAQPGREVMPTQCLVDAPLTYVQELDQEGRAFFWANTRREAAGYLVVTVPAGYLDVITHLRARARPVLDDGAPGRDPTRFRAEAVFEESSHRVSRFFRDDAGTNAMVTTWRFAAEGARLCFPVEFLNARVRGHKATAALAMSAMRSEKVVWKLTWVDAAAGVQHELYVEDRVSAGSPSTSLSALVALAEALVR